MANGFGGALPIERENLHVPLHGDGFGEETDLAVAGLVFDLSRDGQGLAVGAKRVAELRGRGHFDVLANTEGSGEDGHALFDGREKKRFRGWVNRWS